MIFRCSIIAFPYMILSGHYEALKVITAILMISCPNSRYPYFMYITHTYIISRFNASVFILEVFFQRSRQTFLHKPAPSAVTFSTAMYSCSFNCKWKTMRSIVIQLIPPNGIICTQKRNSKCLCCTELNQNFLILVTETEYVWTAQICWIYFEYLMRYKI